MSNNIFQNMFANCRPLTEQEQREGIKAMEIYLLARVIGFPSCPKCPERKEGCHKDCKFVKAYKERNEMGICRYNELEKRWDKFLEKIDTYPDVMTLPIYESEDTE